MTWTTPGYGDIVPITTTGRVCGLVLIISGLITWGVLVANLASFFLAKRLDRVSTDPAIDDLQHRLSRMRHMSQAELIALRGAVMALIDHRLQEQRDISSQD